MSKSVTCPNCNTSFDPNPQENKKESNYIWLFDNGHGGIINGVYQTSGKRSPKWDDGKQLFEGEFNRAIVKRLVKLCNDNGIECVNIVDTQEDVSLGSRVRSANKIAKASDKKCIYISIHANGFNKESANGWSVYTTPGVTKSDKIATVLYEKATAEFKGEKMRRDTRDGDPDKEANFYVIKYTSMPAILSENFFMTNYDNCHKYHLSEEGRDRIAKVHFQMIQEIEAKNEI